MWDAIVIGSGISGLAAAAALARAKRRVLVLEQHSVAGGLTQTFRRGDWTFATGVHYLSGAGPGGWLARLMAALGAAPIEFAASANPYDVVRTPGFEFGIEHPEAAYRAALLARFPAERAAIDAWFAEMAGARRAAVAAMMARGLPPWIARGLRWVSSGTVARHAQRTVAQALRDVADPRLRAVLGARGGDYGCRPSTAPVLEHALVTGAYDEGAWYPVGGPARFAQALVPAIQAAGGTVRLGVDVRTIVVVAGRATGVEWVRGDERGVERAAHVVSTMGLHNTIAALGDAAPPDWSSQARALRAGTASISLYLGLEGDVASDGATSANLWIHEDADVDRFWRSPADEDAPALFVSFPSAKDPGHDGPPTAELIAFCETDLFDRWLGPGASGPDETYRALKDWIEARLLAQFARHFPALAPKVRMHELSTPVTQARYVRTPDGSTYGLEMSAARLRSPALDVRTPVPGLLLAGQDVGGAGVQPSAITGVLAAGAVDRTVMSLMR
jgi:all-trans-retinol 13,14-reductase